jgi:hypothetical protein
MAMIFQDLGMQMSFRDIMCKLCNFLTFPYGTLFLSRGEKGFNGAIGCNFSFFLRSPVQYKGHLPPLVKCKDLILHH